MAGQNNENTVYKTSASNKIKRTYSKGPQGFLEPLRIKTPMCRIVKHIGQSEIKIE